jgi:hypothetical protein
MIISVRLLEMWVTQPKMTKRYKQSTKEIKLKVGTNETIATQKLKPEWLLFNVTWNMSSFYQLLMSRTSYN